MELGDYIAALTKRWLLVALVLVLSVLTAIGVTLLIPPTYQADTRLFVSTQTDANNANQQLFQGGSFAVSRVKSYAELATSPKVLDPVIERLGLSTSAEALARQITTGVPSGTVLLELTVSDRSPTGAAGLANAVTDQLATVIEEIEAPANGEPSPVRVTILKEATPPLAPASPRLPVSIVAGLLAGLILGVGIALLLETLDVTVKNADDLARVTDVPVLATIVLDPEGTTQPIVRGDPHSGRSEAYRQLRANLQFAFVGDRPGVVTVTSAVAGEGKSSVVGNLAVTLQQLGLRVCLVDGDLRRPSLAEYLGLIGEVGLTTVLIGRADLDDVIQTSTPGLDVVTSGPIPPNPSELLASTPMRTALRTLSDRYDMVLVDAPPTLPVADAAVLAHLAGGVLFVVHVGRTTRRQVELALRNLAQANARVLGAVLNMAPSRGRGVDYYTYLPAGPTEPTESAEPTGSTGSTAPADPTPTAAPTPQTRPTGPAGQAPTNGYHEPHTPNGSGRPPAPVPANGFADPRLMRRPSPHPGPRHREPDRTLTPRPSPRPRPADERNPTP